MKKPKNAKKSTAYAIALGLALMAPVALAATHDSPVTSNDTDSDVSVAVTGSNIAVFSNGSEAKITLGNSSAPGTVSVTAGSAENPLTETSAYAIASKNSGSITIYGDAVTLGAYTSYASGNAYAIYNDNASNFPKGVENL